MVLAPSTGGLRQSPKPCQVLKQCGDFRNSIFGSFSFAFWLFSPWGHFSRLICVTELRLWGIHRTPGAGAVTGAGGWAPRCWGQPGAVLGDTMSSRSRGGGQPK